MLDIRLYRDSTGREPFAAWLDGLDHHAAAKVTTAIRRLGSGSLAEVKFVGGGTKKLQQRDIEDSQARWIDHKRRARQ